MREADVEIIIQRALERFPGVAPRIISDNGPQFIARDFKEFIRVSGMTHVRTRLFYPQSNGKIERWHQVLKSECIRPKTPLCLEDARRLVGEFVGYYNEVRLHSAIGYIAPVDKLEGREASIFEQRDQKLTLARELRRNRRALMPPCPNILEPEVEGGHPLAVGQLCEKHGLRSGVKAATDREHPNGLALMPLLAMLKLDGQGGPHGK